MRPTPIGQLDDVVKMHMFDKPLSGGGALEVTEDDLTSGQSGCMIASADNGFMNTDPVICDGNGGRYGAVTPTSLGAFTSTILPNPSCDSASG